MRKTMIRKIKLKRKTIKHTKKNRQNRKRTQRGGMFGLSVYVTQEQFDNFNEYYKLLRRIPNKSGNAFFMYTLPEITKFKNKFKVDVENQKTFDMYLNEMKEILLNYRIISVSNSSNTDY